MPNDYKPLDVFTDEVSAVTTSSPPFPVSALGSVLSLATQTLIDQKKVDASIAANAMLGAAACVTQPRWNVLGRLYGPTPLSIFSLSLLKSGGGKSDCERMAFRCIEEAQNSLLGASRSNGASHDTIFLQKDVSAEGGLKLLDKHTSHLCIRNGDAGSFFGGYAMQPEKIIHTASTLCDLWSGSTAIKMRANLEQPLYLPNRRISIILAAQPGIAADAINNPNLHSIGFWARFLVVCPTVVDPVVPAQWNNTPEWQKFEDRIKDIMDSVPINTVPDTGAIKFLDLQLTNPAYDIYIDIQQHYIDLQKAGNKALEPQYRRVAEHTLRLAGIMSAFDGKSELDVTEMENAVVLAHYYLQEWESVHHRIDALDNPISEAKKLWDWMVVQRKKGNDKFSLRQIYQSGPRLCRNNKQKTKELMIELWERGYIRSTANDRYEMRPDA